MKTTILGAHGFHFRNKVHWPSPATAQHRAAGGWRPVSQLTYLSETNVERAKWPPCGLHCASKRVLKSWASRVASKGQKHCRDLRGQ